MKARNLNDKQLERISEIFGNLGIGVAIAVIIPAFLLDFNKSSIIYGSLVTGLAWFISIKILSIWKQ